MPRSLTRCGNSGVARTEEATTGVTGRGVVAVVIVVVSTTTPGSWLQLLLGEADDVVVMANEDGGAVVDQSHCPEVFVVFESAVVVVPNSWVLLVVVG